MDDDVNPATPTAARTYADQIAQFIDLATARAPDLDAWDRVPVIEAAAAVYAAFTNDDIVFNRWLSRAAGTSGHLSCLKWRRADAGWLADLNYWTHCRAWQQELEEALENLALVLGEAGAADLAELGGSLADQARTGGDQAAGVVEPFVMLEPGTWFDNTPTWVKVAGGLLVAKIVVDAAGLVK